MHMFHIPQYTIQNRNVPIFVLNGALWDMEQMHCRFCELGQFYYSKRGQCMLTTHESQIILGMGPANERRHYIATPPLIVWAHRHTQNDAWLTEQQVWVEWWYIANKPSLIQRKGWEIIFLCKTEIEAALWVHICTFFADNWPRHKYIWEQFA